MKSLEEEMLETLKKSREGKKDEHNMRCVTYKKRRTHLRVQVEGTKEDYLEVKNELRKIARKHKCNSGKEMSWDIELIPQEDYLGTEKRWDSKKKKYYPIEPEIYVETGKFLHAKKPPYFL